MEEMSGSSGAGAENWKPSEDGGSESERMCQETHVEYGALVLGSTT